MDNTPIVFDVSDGDSTYSFSSSSQGSSPEVSQKAISVFSNQSSHYSLRTTPIPIRASKIPGSFLERQGLRLHLVALRNFGDYQDVKSRMHQAKKIAYNDFKDQVPSDLFTQILTEVIEEKFKEKSKVKNSNFDQLVMDVAESCFGSDHEHYLSWVETICYNSLKEGGLDNKILHQAEVARCVAHIHEGLEHIVILPDSSQRMGVVARFQLWISGLFSSKLPFEFSVFRGAIEKLCSADATPRENQIGAVALQAAWDALTEAQKKQFVVVQDLSFNKDFTEFKGFISKKIEGINESNKVFEQFLMPIMEEAAKKGVPVPYVLPLIDQALKNSSSPYVRLIRSGCDEIRNTPIKELLKSVDKEHGLIKVCLAASCDPHNLRTQSIVATMYARFGDSFRSVLNTYGDPAFLEVVDLIDLAKRGDADFLVKAVKIYPNPELIGNIDSNDVTHDLVKGMLAIASGNNVLKCMCLMLLVRGPQDVAKEYSLQDLKSAKEVLAENLATGVLPLENMKQVYKGLKSAEGDDLVNNLRSANHRRVKEFLNWVDTDGIKERVRVTPSVSIVKDLSFEDLEYERLKKEASFKPLFDEKKMLFYGEQHELTLKEAEDTVEIIRNYASCVPRMQDFREVLSFLNQFSLSPKVQKFAELNQLIVQTKKQLELCLEVPSNLEGLSLDQVIEEHVLNSDPLVRHAFLKNLSRLEIKNDWDIFGTVSSRWDSYTPLQQEMFKRFVDDWTTGPRLRFENVDVKKALTALGFTSYLEKMAADKEYSGIPLAIHISHLLEKGKVEKANELSEYIKIQREAVKAAALKDIKVAEKAIATLKNGERLNENFDAEVINPNRFIANALEDEKTIGKLVVLAKEFGGNAESIDDVRQAQALLKSVINSEWGKQVFSLNLKLRQSVENAIFELMDVTELSQIETLSPVNFLTVFALSPDPRVRNALLLSVNEIEKGLNVQNTLNEAWATEITPESIKLFLDEQKMLNQERVKTDVALKGLDQKPSLVKDKLGDPLDFANDVDLIMSLLLKSVTVNFNEEEPISDLRHFSRNLFDFTVLSLLSTGEERRVDFFMNLCREFKKSDNLYALKIIAEALQSCRVLNEKKQEELKNIIGSQILPPIQALLQDLKEKSKPLSKVDGELIVTYAKQKESLANLIKEPDNTKEISRNFSPFFERELVLGNEKVTGDYITYLLVKRSSDFLQHEEINALNDKAINRIAEKITLEEFKNILIMYQGDGEYLNHLVDAIIEKRDFKEIREFYDELTNTGNRNLYYRFVNNTRFADQFSAINDNELIDRLARFISPINFARILKKHKDSPNCEQLMICLAKREYVIQRDINEYDLMIRNMVSSESVFKSKKRREELRDIFTREIIRNKLNETNQGVIVKYLPNYQKIRDEVSSL